MHCRELLARAVFGVLVCNSAGAIVAIGGEASSSAPAATASEAPATTGTAPMAGMPGMSGHMHMTELRPKAPGDQRKADAIVVAAKQAMAPYEDYHKAIADGYEIFLPDVPQPQYHFTNKLNGLAARSQFDPSKPTSLLYKKTADGGYRLVGVMYTDRVDAPLEEIDGRIPLSVARWHQHVNFCRAPLGHKAEYFGPDAKYGLLGSIDTKEACEAAGGTFYPHLFGWMVHVYPNEQDPKMIWSTTDDDAGHDNMDSSSMPAMKMP
jgi:hypothetical protein